MELKKLRKENHLSQVEIADMLNIGQSAYSMIENKQRNLSVENAKKLGEIFHIDWWHLYEPEITVVEQ